MTSVISWRAFVTVICLAIAWLLFKLQVALVEDYKTKGAAVAMVASVLFCALGMGIAYGG